jgi:hypothetical protein
MGKPSIKWEIYPRAGQNWSTDWPICWSLVFFSTKFEGPIIFAHAQIMTERVSQGPKVSHVLSFPDSSPILCCFVLGKEGDRVKLFGQNL